MNEDRFKCILSVLNWYELTWREKQFVEAVKRYFNENGILTEQQESILEGIYREKNGLGRLFSVRIIYQRTPHKKLYNYTLLNSKGIKLFTINFFLKAS